ncbi:ribonuclease H, partial [Trifolium pratense]
MNGDGAPGPDGFGGHFFQCYWHIVAVDVINSVQHFFINGKLLNNLNSNLLIIIPKTPGADRIENFRPIALANFQFKIITKLLADRLAIIASKIIPPQQRGFIPNRSIADCVIVVASEAINVLSKRSFAGNLALKIDIKKAFDTLDWSFLLQVLHQFGFHDNFCGWIKEIPHSARLSILINGKSVGYLLRNMASIENCARGVRQGDPLSPLLFCLVEEMVSRCLSNAQTNGSLQPMLLCRGVAVPSHVLYADDIMVFCKGTIPFTYLGCPMFVGKPEEIQFQTMADRIKVKLATYDATVHVNKNHNAIEVRCGCGGYRSSNTAAATMRT